MKIIPENPVVRILISSILAFIAFGGWGYFANIEEGHMTALKAGILQGSFSFIFTLVGSAIMEFMVRLSEDNLKRFLMAVVTNLTVVYGFIISGHIISGTPNIILTILPGVIITSFYCISYSWFLTYGHAAGGSYKMVQLIKTESNPDYGTAIQLIEKMTEATQIQARRAVEEISIGRKSSLYLKNSEQVKHLISELKNVGLIAKPL